MAASAGGGNPALGKGATTATPPAPPDLGSMCSTRALLCLDGTTGARICCKYYGSAATGPKALAAQLELERTLFAKCGAAKNAFQEVLLVTDPTTSTSTPSTVPGSCLVVGKQSLDTCFFVVGPASENEIFLFTILHAWFSAVECLCGAGGVEKRVLFENMDLLLLAMDDILLEVDGKMIASRVSRASDGEDLAAAFLGTDQTLTSALRIAQEQLARSLLK